MDVADFNKPLNPLLGKLSQEHKQVILLGHFNINLLNFNDHQPTNEFSDSTASNSFILYILQPTRLTSHSKTLMDSIAATISDHLPQFLFVLNVLSNPSCQKSSIYERNWSKFIQKKFVLDFFLYRLV